MWKEYCNTALGIVFITIPPTVFFLTNGVFESALAMSFLVTTGYPSPG
jgi:hypothetical protein